MKVGDIMTRDLVTAGPDTGVDAIARLMLERHIVDSKRRLVGILRDHDIPRHPPKDSPGAW